MQAEVGYMTPLPPPGSAEAASVPLAAKGEDGLAPTDDGGGAFSYTFDHRTSGASRDIRNAELDRAGRQAAVKRAAGAASEWTLRDFRAVSIADARQQGPTTLDRQGFVLRSDEGDSEFVAGGGDFYDPAAVQAGYYKEVEALLKREAGVDSVVVFDHITRDISPPACSAAAADPRGYVSHVHCDYTEVGAARRAEQLLGTEAAGEWGAGGRRLGVMQVCHRHLLRERSSST